MQVDDGYYATLAGAVVKQAILDADDPKYTASESDLDPFVFLDSMGISRDLIPSLAERIRQGEVHHRAPRSTRKAA